MVTCRRSLRLGEYGLPRMADVGEIVVELVDSDAPVVGVSEIGVLPVAPALASALSTITGRRYRHLPLGMPRTGPHISPVRRAMSAS